MVPRENRSRGPLGLSLSLGLGMGLSPSLLDAHEAPRPQHHWGALGHRGDHRIDASAISVHPHPDDLSPDLALRGDEPQFRVKFDQLLEEHEPLIGDHDLDASGHGANGEEHVVSKFVKPLLRGSE